MALDKQEKQDMVNFLKSRINPALVELITDEDMLANTYKLEHEKWVNSQLCKVNEKLTLHEENFSRISKDFLEVHKADISAFVDSNIGNKQSQTLKFSEKLADNRRLDVQITGIRKVLLTPEEIQKPADLMAEMKKAFLEKLSLKTSVDLCIARKRSISALKKEDQVEDDNYRYNVHYVLRDRTKAEEKEDNTPAKK